MRRLITYAPAACVFALALLVRVLYNLTVARNYIPVFDAALYHTLGRQLVERGCYCLYNHNPSVSRAPLWPFILAIIYALAGKEEVYGRLFYCLLGSGTCTLIYFFSRDLFGRKIALLSGILAAPVSGSLLHDAYNYTPGDDAADTARALNWIRAHLSTLPYLLALHFINMWIPYTYSHGLAFEEFPGSFVSYFMIFLIYALATPVILAAFVGLFLTWKQYKRQLLAVYLLLALVTLQNVIFYSDMRFRAPIEPVLLLLAGRALYGLISAGWNRLNAQIQWKSVSRV